MNATSPKKSFDVTDFINLMKNIGIFFAPLFVAIETALKSGQPVQRWILWGLAFSCGLKFLEYYYTDNTIITPDVLVDRKEMADALPPTSDVW